MSDMVNHPSHYQHGSMETIDKIEFELGTRGCIMFCLGNVIKYRDRAPYKGNESEDLAKADWYLNKAKELYNKPKPQWIGKSVDYFSSLRISESIKRLNDYESKES